MKLFRFDPEEQKGSKKVANESELISAFRKKYIATMMIMVAMLCGVIFMLVLAFNYQNQLTYVNNSLAAAFKNPNTSGRVSAIIGYRANTTSGGEGPTFKEPAPTSLVQNTVPVYIVRTDTQGGVIMVESDKNIKMYSPDFLKNAITEALGTPYYSGCLPDLRLYYSLAETQEGYRIGFADARPVFESMKGATIGGLVLIATTLLFFSVIASWLSKLAVTPIQEAWEAQKRFIADASHELKTPLTVILANTDIVLDNQEETVASQKKWIISTREEAQGMQSLVQDLLTLSRLQSQGVKSPEELAHSYETVNFSEVCFKQSLQLESLAFEKGVSLAESIDPDIELYGNADELERLFKILLDNAIKYVNPGGSIEVSLEDQAESCVLSVNNTGEPISPDDLQSIFKRFYRSDSSRDRKSGGFGLGLAIAHSIVGKHQGIIRASSDELNGTTFHVELPKLNAQTFKPQELSEDKPKHSKHKFKR